MLVNHPDTYREGCRVLVLSGRNKDGAEKTRTIRLVSYDVEAFNFHLAELLKRMRPHERIYGSASVRSTEKAVRILKQRMLENDYDDQPLKFYHRLEDRWTSCLMSPQAQEIKYWMFDCDEDKDTTWVADDLERLQIPAYKYRSKSGHHFLCKPFNRKLLKPEALKCLHVNPLMLWAY